MPDESDLCGRRATVEIEGQRRAGTITSITYTLKGGQPVVRLELDAETPGGRDAVACALENVTFGEP
jgi:hypothetical protein